MNPTQAISPWGALGKTTSVTAPIKAGGKVRVKALPSQIPKQNLSRLPLHEAYLGVLLFNSAHHEEMSYLRNFQSRMGCHRVAF